MTAPAARQGDAISHTGSATGFGLGGTLGLAAGLALLTVATGGADLAVLAAVGGAVALTGGGALAGMKIGATYGHATGDITTGSPNVHVNARNAARTLADVAVCDEHDAPQKIATGSTSVFINGMPAARLGDLTICDARITSASSNVFIGGGTGSYANISPEVPQLAVDIAASMAIAGTALALGAGGAAAFASAGWAGVGVFGLQSAGGIAGGAALGAAGKSIGGALDGARGAAWGEAIGGLGGGLAGGAAAGRLGSASIGNTAGSVPGEQILGVRSADDVNAEMVANGQDPAWQSGTDVTSKIVPAGTNYNMVVSQGQASALEQGGNAYGGWASGDPIPSQDYARNGLAIQPAYKDDVSMVAQVQTTQPQQINSGTVGPQGDLPGQGSQVQFVGDRNLQLAGSPQSIPVSSPALAPSPGSASIGAVAGSRPDQLPPNP